MSVDTDTGDISLNLSLDTKGFTLNANRAGETLKQLRISLEDTRKAADHDGGPMGGAAKGFRGFMLTAAAARFAVLDFYDLFLRFPATVLKANAELERMNKMLEGMSTATDKVADAQRQQQYIFNMAKNAPFEVKSLTDAYVKLKSGGIDPANGSLKALVDSVAKFGGDSQALHRASIAIQQMAGKGAISMEELRQQLGEAVPSAMKDMATGMGITMAELVKRISSGTVEARSALDRMFAVMSVTNAGAAEAMMTTWSGLFERLKTEWTLLTMTMGGGNAADGPFAQMKQGIIELTDALKGGFGRELATDIQLMLSQIVKGIKALGAAFVENYETIKTVMKLLIGWFVAAKVAMPILGGIGDKYKELTGVLNQHYGEIEAKRRQNIDSLRAEARVTAQAAAEVNKQIAAKKIEMQESRALAAIAAEDEKKAAAVRDAARNSKIDGVRVTNDMRNANRALAAESASQAAAFRTAAEATGKEIVALQEARREKVLATKATRDQISALNALPAATSGVKGAMSGIGAVFSSMNLGVMAATMALGFLIKTLMDWANASENAATRARNAYNGLSSAKELNETKGDISTLRGTITNEEDGLEDYRRAMGEAAYEKRVKKIAEDKKELERLIKLRDVQLLNVQTAAAQDYTTQVIALTKTQEAQISAGIVQAKEHWQRWRDSEEERINASLTGGAQKKALEKLQTEYSAKTKSIGTLVNGVKTDTLRGMVANQRALLDKTTDKDERAKIQAAIAGLDKLIEEVTASQIKVEKIGTDAVSLKPSKGNKESSPIKNIIARLGGEVAELDERFANWNADLTNKADIYKRNLAKYEALLKSGKLKDKDGVNPKYNDMVKAARGESAAEFDRQAVKTKDELQNLINSARSEAEVARRSLDSPYAGKETELEKIDLIIAKMRDKKDVFDAMAKSYAAANPGKTLEGAVKDLRSDTAVKAAADDYKMLIAENDKYRVEFAATEEARVAAVISAERRIIEEKRAAAQKNIDEANVTPDERAAMQSALNANVAYQQESLARKTEGPMKQMLRNWQDTNAAMAQASTGWMSGFADGLTEMAMGGKFVMKDFAQAIVKDLIKIQIRALLTKAVLMAIGMVGGYTADMSQQNGTVAGTSNFVGPMPQAKGGAWMNGIQAFAKGGMFTNQIVSSPTLFKFAKGTGLMGEAGPEAIMPLQRDSQGRLGVIASGAGGGGVQINITVNNDGTTDASSTGRDEATWRSFANRVKGMIQQEIITQKRPGGTLYA